MKIVVNHLTRMQPGWVCAAGIEVESKRHIRPVTGLPLGVSLLAEHGGPFALGRLLDLGETRFCGRMPEIEDRLFQPEAVEVLRNLDARELYQCCAEVAGSRLRDIFGPELEWISHRPDHPGTAAVPERRGMRSLGCYWAQSPELSIVCSEGRRKVRFCFAEEEMQFSVAVTDIRLYQADHVSPNENVIAELQQALAGQPRVLVSIGLSRAYHYDERHAPQHWLQINNIHAAEPML